LLGATGCSQVNPGASSGTSAPASPAAANSPAAETSSPAASAAPDGYQYVTASASGFRLAVPTDWSTVATDKVTSNPDVRQALDDVASRMGTTTDQLLSAGIDLVMVSPSGIPNANVVKPEAGTITSDFASQITTQLETAFSATGVTTRQVTTAAGDAVVASYTASMMGTTVYQNQIYLQVSSSQISVITVTGKDAAQAQDLANVIVDTISRV